MQCLRKTWQLNGFQVVHVEAKQLKKRKEVSETSYVQKTTRDLFKRTVLWNLLKLATSWIGLVRDLRRTEPKQMELQNELYDE